MQTPQGLLYWHRAARTLQWQWWGFTLLALFGTLLFFKALSSHDPATPAVILLIPLISLRQAWKTDRKLALCRQKIIAAEPTIASPTEPEEAMTITEKATFAAGCFWGVEEMFRKVPGVLSTRVGYTAGKTANPTYEQVCTGRTGHAEAIEITFDPSIVSYATLVDLFYENHDPTTLDRQGPDVGTQYRSGIYTHSPEQEQTATGETEKRQSSGDYARPIVTEILPAETFYSAEEYHQKYFADRGVNWSCHSGNGKRVQRKAAAH